MYSIRFRGVMSLNFDLGSPPYDYHPPLLLKTQVQEVKALGGGRWRWTRHQSTKQTDIEFAMNQVDLG